MDLRRLRHAVVLQEEGSFARASRRLHITQSALTKSVRTLETELGIKLFDRNSRGIFPTSAGLQVLEQAQRLLLHASGMEHNVELLRNAELGNVTFGVGPVLADIAIPVLAELCDHHPRITVSLEIEAPDYLLERLLGEKIELMFGNTSQQALSPLLVRRPLAELPLGYFVRRGHPLLSLGRIAPEALQPFPLIGPSYNERWLDRPPAGVVPLGLFASRTNCENFHVMKEVARSSNAVLLSSRITVAEEVAAGDLQELRLTRTNHSSAVHLVHFSDRALSPAAQRVVALMEQALRRRGLACDNAPAPDTGRASDD